MKTARMRNGSATRDLFGSVKEMARASLVELLKESSRDAVRWALTLFLLYAVAAGLLAVGLTMLLVGGVLGLKEASLPEWAAWSIAGVAGLLAGGIALASAVSRMRR